MAAAVLLAACGASLNADAQSGLLQTDAASNGASAVVKAASDSERPDSAGATAVKSRTTAQPKSAVAQTAQAPDVKSAGLSAAGKQAAAVTSVATPGNDAYRIGPQDVLEISVFKAPELSKSVQVADNGLINLPLLNEVPAAGKTAQEVERDLATKLGSKYLQKPQVTVYVKEYNSQRVTVEGAVKKPGVYPIRGRMSLLQLAASAEGTTDLSDQSMVVFRMVDGKRTGAQFDLAAIRSGTVADPHLQAGDVIIAPTSAFKEAYSTLLKAVPMAAFVPLL